MQIRVSRGDEVDEHDLEISASPSISVRHLAAALGAPSGPLSADGRVLDLDVTLGASGLHDGSLLRVGSASSIPSVPLGQARLMVTGGPDSGFSHTLGLSRYTIGRGDDADIRINDSDVSRSHCEISLTESGASLRDLNSTNGTAVNGRLLGDAIAPISPGDLIGIGTSSLQLLKFEDRRAQLKSDGDGGFVFNRSPRILKSPETVEIVVPSPPRVPSKRPFPWIAALAPLAVAILMAVLLKQPTFLLFAVLSPVTVFGTQWAERRHDRREYESAVADHQEESEQYERELGQALDAERQLIAQLWPDPAAAVSACTGPGLRLWERRTADPDYLNIRVGVHTGPANIKLRALATGRTLDAPELRDAPTGFNLRETGVAGVAMPGQTGRGVLRAMITQLIAFHAADDLRLCVVAPHSTWHEFKWLRWAPHLRARDLTGPLQLALDMSSARAMVDELVRVMTTRREQRSSNQHLSFLPDYVVLLDQASELRRDSELGRLLREGPDLGVYALCIEDDDRKLPEECRAVLTASASAGTTGALQLPDGSSVTPILLDQVQTEIAAGASRSIAGVRRVSVAGGESEVPPTCRLFDLYPDDVLDPASIAHRWHTAGKTTSAVVGMGADGPERLDIAADGPHVLIAGTPGSGKSEFLQSWITSLALCNRPDEFTFILIDFKGGAAFSELGRLPHTVGVLTNLDQQLTGRALTSLESELRRRQEIFARHGTTEHKEYSTLRAQQSSLPAIPRLAIVIDEFAEMKDELPDFVEGLTRVARLGRSLGIHLVLATQRPSGAVSAEIRSNSNLRIALRVTDVGDSVDVLDSAEAAAISKSTPGRAYARIGQEPLRVFQTGRVRGSSIRATNQGPLQVRELSEDDWLHPRSETPREDLEESDLDVAVRSMQDAAAMTDLATIAAPWAPPLPSSVAMHSLPASLVTSGIPLGLVDLPEEQRTGTWCLPWGQNALIVGSSRSGRTTTLRTLAASVSQSSEPAHLYVWDGGGGLTSLSALPSVGTVVPRGKPELGERLLRRLGVLIEDRAKELARENLASIHEQHDRYPAHEHMPWIVVLVDRWESLEEGAQRLGLDEMLLGLMSEGPSVGMFFVIAGDQGLARPRFQSAAPCTLALRLNDPSLSVTLDLPFRTDLSALDPGRAVIAPNNQMMQVAVLADGSGAQETAALMAMQHTELPAHSDSQIVRLVELPDSVHLDEIPSSLSYSGALIGLGGDGSDPISVDPDGGLLVAGQRRSGRSQTLATVFLGIRKERTVTLVCAAASPLAPLGDRSNVARHDLGSTAIDWTAMDPSALLILDDAERLVDTSGFLMWLRASSARAVVASVDLDACAFPAAHIRELMHHCATSLVLSPLDHMSAANVGVQVSRAGGIRGPAGRGILADHSGQTVVQVAVTRPGESTS